MKAISLISGHGGINDLRPGRNPAIQVVEIFKSVALQELRDLHAAGAMMADHDDCRIRIKRSHLGWYGAHGNVNGILNMANLELPRLAYVK